MTIGQPVVIVNLKSYYCEGGGKVDETIYFTYGTVLSFDDQTAMVLKSGLFRNQIEKVNRNVIFPSITSVFQKLTGAE